MPPSRSRSLRNSTKNIERHSKAYSAENKYLAGKDIVTTFRRHPTFKAYIHTWLQTNKRKRRNQAVKYGDKGNQTKNQAWVYEQVPN
jgi:hypothetical protein